MPALVAHTPTESELRIFNFKHQIFIMSLRTFVLGLSVSFGIAWLSVVVVPYFKMKNLAPIPFEESTATAGVFFPKRTGRVLNGAQVYAENGCYLCHTQVVRHTDAGNDMFRPDWGGLAKDADRGDTRRETNAFDFLGEKYAQIGMMRMGPDLSNLGRRVETQYAKGKSPEAWLYAHLYNPRNNPELWQSVCPPHPFLFEKREIKGQRSDEALDVKTRDGYEVLPGSDARALVSYLISLKKDQAVPPSLDFSKKKK
jgi:cytochrome c oxidase cbb3-type subunit 2